MEVNHEGTSGSGTVPEGETSVGETVEIKIKTLDSQSYTLRVEKNVAVPALKEKLASVVGVPVESQRLICRGKVLKDDQLLSAYNVGDGHTLHLVARQPLPTSGVGPNTVNNEDSQGETGMPPPGGRSGHVSHSLVMETINFPDSGEGQLPDMNRIINAIMSSIGVHGGGSLQGGTENRDISNSGVLPILGGLDNGATADGRNSGSDQGTRVRELELQIDALYGMPSNSARTSGQSPIRRVQPSMVVPDALTTMSQYLDRLEQSSAAEESTRTTNSQDIRSTEVRVATDVCPTQAEPRRGASPTALGALVNRVNNFLRGQASSALSCLASRLESEPTMEDAAARDDVQHAAFHDGNLMQQIGALILELGRAMLSLRMGQSPSESVVNSGPAIFISPAGPNLMMVQGANVSQFRHAFDSSHMHHHHIALPQQAVPRQSSSGVADRTGLPSIPGTLGPSRGVPRLPRSIHLHIHTIDPRTFIVVPSSSLSTPPRPSSFEERFRVPTGVTGLTVWQILERADSRNASHAGSAPNDASGSTRPNHSNTDAADGTNSGPENFPSGPTGMQGALMTVDENGAVRMVPVRSHGAVHVPFGHIHVDSLLPRFQRQFNFRTSSNLPNDTHVSAATYAFPSASTDSPRQMDQASPSLPGEGGRLVSGSGEVSHIMNSLAPLLQHLAGTLQQSGAPTPPQQQPPLSTDIVERPFEVRPTDDAPASIESPNRESNEPALDFGVTSMVSEEQSGDHERSQSSFPLTLQGQTLEAGGDGSPSGGTLDASVTTPIELRLGGLQSLTGRVRRRRQTQQSSQDGHQQLVQETLQNLRAHRNLTNNMDQRTSMPTIEQFVRAIEGGDGQQSGPNIIGQFMRSPVVENLVQQVMQGVGDVNGGGGARRGPSTGGLDLSSMLQHVVPVVTQMFNGGSSTAFPGSTAGTSPRISSHGATRATASREPESERWQDALTPEEVVGWSETIAIDEERPQSIPAQHPLNDVYRRGTPAAKKQKTAVELTTEKLEDGASAEVVLRDLADAASAGISGNDGTTSTDQHVLRVDELAKAYLVLQFNDLAARVAVDPDFGDGSRFPNAARIFPQSQPSHTPTEPDGE